MTFTRIGLPTTRLHLESLEDRSVPSTFTVNTTLDDTTPANGKLSLREAITKANTTAGADVIVLPAGVFKITIDGVNENANATGDFDVTDSVTFQGAGAGLTIIDAQQKDRLFDVGGSITAKFADLSLRHGAGPNNGAAIQAVTANIKLVRCVLSDNKALVGGGINAEGGNVTLIDCTIARNVSQGVGGGIHLGTGTLSMSGSSVRRNLSGGDGGGIDSDSSVKLTNCTVSGNSASTLGGGINASDAKLENCTVNGNLSGGGGGGIRARGAALANCTISGNSAGGNGGGIFIHDVADILNCTIVENNALSGGGVFCDPAGGTQTVYLNNTIVALNLVDFTDTNPDVSGGFTGAGHNLIGDSTGSTGFLNGVNGDMVGTSATPIDPKLGPLQNNGGPTQTMALKAGSPAIDHGRNTNLLLTDQRGLGFPRRKDGNGDGVAIVDIGAFER